MRNAGAEGVARSASPREAQARQRAASREDRSLNRSPAKTFGRTDHPGASALRLSRHPSSARRGMLLGGATLWCLSIVAAPVLDLSGVYRFFAAICHQDPSRSWYLFGESLHVCIRCASIYFAFTASLWLGLKANVRWLRIAVVLMLCEFVIARLVIDAAVLRSLSGILVGLSAAPFIKQGVEELRDAM